MTKKNEPHHRASSDTLTKVSAREAGLHYVSANKPGIRRIRSGKGFRYLMKNGRGVRDAKTLARIRSLVLPPAWENVWICEDPLGHIQATGIDARGRKQYRYHAIWRERRSEKKFQKMLPFAQVLPRIRRRVRSDLQRPALCKEKVVAAVVSLLEETKMRIGSEEYARENHTFGLTTLQDRHVRIHGTRMTFRFKGKSGRQHTLCICDHRIAKIVRECQELPGQHLFEFCDASGCYQSVESAHVNAYLHAITGGAFTAKDYRTWSGTMLATCFLAKIGKPHSEREAKRNVAQAVRAVAERLGNTESVCRHYYIHPGIISAYCEGKLKTIKPDGKHRTSLSPEELFVMKMLTSFELQR